MPAPIRGAMELSKDTRDCTTIAPWVETTLEAATW